MTPAFLDTNVPIYATGRPHPLKDPCAQILALVAEHPAAFVTDAEVLQELLHRFVALRMWPEPGRLVFDRFTDLVRERVEPVHAVDVEGAANLSARYPRLAARDLVHLAVMKRLGSNRIVSADTGFDRLPEIERLDPAQVATWRRELTEQGEA